MKTSDQLLKTLRTWRRMPAKQLLDRLQISRATLMRAVQGLGSQVVARGQARRTAYAARRAIRGQAQALTLFRVDEQGQGREAARLFPIYPEGCALEFLEPFEWPLDDTMRDGWFDGLPFVLEDMRPQGFLGRRFARQHAGVLQVGEDPRLWSEDDVLHALSLLGSDEPGSYILGEPAYRRFLASGQEAAHFLSDAQAKRSYPAKAEEAMTLGPAGSSAGGEFPKFTAQRLVKGEPRHVIVKFSGADQSPGTERWADLLVCEHLALRVLAKQLHIEAATSRIFQTQDRTFLEVERFDRHGLSGRSSVCSLAALNGGLSGLAGKPWPVSAAALHQQGWLSIEAVTQIHTTWLFGQLIANTDMHDGNLAFRPGNRSAGSASGLTLAPIYDMLPMHYAPVRGQETPNRDFTPPLPLPAEQNAWQLAAKAASFFWSQAAQDERISPAFRRLCEGNVRTVQALAKQ